MSTQSTVKTNLLAAGAALAVMVLALFVFSIGDGDPTTIDASDSGPIASETTAAPDSPDTASPDTASPDTASPDGEGPDTTLLAEAEQAATFSDLPTITIDELPIEAIETLLLIDDGGPYPYRQDDGTFQNREGILPDRSLGHYREYTVDTPGSPDRGARRIVSGADGERYYTDDHYDSFREITP